MLTCIKRRLSKDAMRHALASSQADPDTTRIEAGGRAGGRAASSRAGGRAGGLLSYCQPVVNIHGFV